MNYSDHSIRNSLEKEAWRCHPSLALKMAHRRQTQTGKQKSLRWQDRTLLIIGIILLSLVLLRIETAGADANANTNTNTGEEVWGLELNTANSRTTQMAINTDIRVEVSGLIARAEITQIFSNPGNEWAEGIYRFPLPDGAAVDRMQIHVGEKIIEGEIQERESARHVYQQALTEGFTASLVEQHKANQFETRLANIGPGEEIQVTIGFLLNVKYEEGGFSLRLPTTFAPRWNAPVAGVRAMSALEPLVPQPLLSQDSGIGHRLNLEFLIRTSIGFAAIESRYHDVDIAPTNDGYLVKLLDEAEVADRDFELAWYPDLQTVPQTTLMTWDGGDAIYAQLMMLPPLSGSISRQSREVVFIIDTSGSMEGDSLRQASSALIKGLEELQPDDRFNLIRFSSDTAVLFNESLPAIEENLNLARHYIDGLSANGGTVMAPALDAAFSLPVQFGLMRQVIFVTDGSVGNEKALLSDIAEDLGDSRLFTVGIGSAPNTWFMRKAAEIGRGSHTHIGKLDEVELRMSKLWTNIRLPALSDICVDWGTDAEYFPEIIPDLYAGEPLWVVARLSLLPGQISVCGLLNGQNWENISQPFETKGSNTIATLWARKKVEALEESIVFGADQESTRAQITQVALDYGLLTSQTSLVAVDKTPARLSSEKLNTEHIPSLLPAGSGQSIGFAQTATGWRTQLLLSLLTLFISGWMYWAAGSRLPLGASTSATR